MIPRVEKQNVKTFIRLMRKAAVKIVDHRARGRQDGPVRQWQPQDMKLRCTDAAEPVADPPVAGGPTEGLRRCGENSRQVLEPAQQRSRPAPAQPSIDELEERRQHGSAPAVLSRRRCHEVAAARRISIG